MDYNKPPPYNPGNYPQNQPQGHPYQPQQQPQYYPPPPSQINVTMAPPTTNTVIVTQGQVVTGNCPACRRGVLGYDFTCCGICCAIFFFPIGIICCFLFAKKRCSSCRAYF